jgi:hypothetical protein
MFKENTVFIVGAGASSEYGLPLGAGLSARISENLTVIRNPNSYGSQYADTYAERLLQGRFKDDKDGLNAAFEAGALIQKGILHAQSIDAFIDMHADKPAVAVVGKLQIALEILRAEQASKLYVDPGNIYNRIDFAEKSVASSWLRVFTEILLEKARASDLSSIGRGVTIICFNYDRCIEHYLIQAIEATLGVTYEQAHSVVSGMEIVHPYGHLGILPTRPGADGAVPFGVEVDRINIWKIADGLSTFTEEMADQEQLSRIRKATSEATTLVCLGFGFQSQNVQLLDPQSTSPTKLVNTISTGVGIHNVIVPEVTKRLTSIVGRNLISGRAKHTVMTDVGCGQLMRHNRLALSAE